MIGRQLNHYEVLSPLGKGGMGEVYLAEDSKLRRKVALKVLPSEMAANPDHLARFQREARAVAALNHPNIVTIHSVEEAEGVHFLTMELVEGGSLDEYLTEEGLSVEKFLEIAVALAEALSAAHSKAITHRDLKPQNVMMGHDGRIKVVDFGLAKFAVPSLDEGADSAFPTEARTREGVIIGTVPYMSPEQVEGRNADQRSDVFSLGVVLYEMATGRRPFQGDTAITTLSSILKDQPPSVKELKPDLPDALSTIIGRCLAKDPNARYQNAQELLRDLSQVVATSPAVAATKSAPSDAPWIAVARFQTKGSELESFADGLTEDITAGLSRFSHLYVVSQSSSTRHQERFALEGSVRQAGSSVRVNVKLLDATTGNHLWAEHFDRDLSGSDLFTAQDELTDRIVATVADTYGVLSRSLAALVKEKPVEEMTAYDCVLRMFGYWQQLIPQEHAEVRTALEQVLDREPNHADAWGCLSWIYVAEHKLGFNPRPHPLDRALSAARRAVEIDGTSQMAYSALAHAHYCRRELSAFRPAAERVLTLNPRETHHVAFMGLLISTSGDWTQGLSVMRQAIALNPHHAGWFHLPFVWDHYRKRDYEKALQAAELINMPGFYKAPAVLAATNAQLGRDKRAREHLKHLLELVPDYGQWAREDWSKEFVSEELVEHVLEGLRKAGLEIGEAASVPSETREPFVGREAEQRKLVARLDGLSQGAGALVLIGGEPGVGKTRLAEEVLADARERSMLAVTGHCYEEGAQPFMPFVEILERMLREIPDKSMRKALGDAPTYIGDLVPELRRKFDDIEAPIELPPEQQRRALFNDVLDFLQRLSAEHPVVLLLDDLHWADDATLALLQHVTPHLSQAPMLVVGTYRDVELDVGKPFEKAMATLVRQKLAERLPLKRLPEEAVAELLAALGGGEPPESLVHVIFNETEGNPFFVGEVFQHLSEDGKLIDDAGDWKTDVSVDELDVPEGVRLVIGRRLERLSETTPKMLTAAAIVGRRFELALVEALSDLDGDAFLDAVEEAETAKLVAPQASGRETSYAFTHELIRHTLMGTLSLPRRQRLHLRVAEAIEQTYPKELRARASDLAHHLYEAGRAADLEKTVHYLVMAGDNALRAGAPDEAARVFDSALTLLEDNGSKLEAEILYKRGTAHRALGHWDEGAADWEWALPFFERARDHDIVSRICSGLAYRLIWANRNSEALEIVARGMRVVGEEASAALCRLLGNAAHAHSLKGEFAEGLDLSDRAVSMAEALGDERLLASEVLLGRIYLFWNHLTPRRMVDVGERAIELARRSGTPWDLSSALGITQIGWCSLARFDLPLRNLSEIEALAARTGDLATQFCTSCVTFLLRLAEGELKSAEEHIANLIEYWKTRFPWVSLCYSMLGRVQLRMGNAAAAWDNFNEAVRLAPVGVHFGFDQAQQILGMAYGDVDVDASRMQHVKGLLPRPGADTSVGTKAVLLCLVEALAVMGRRDEAAELYPLMQQKLDPEMVFLFDLGPVEKVAGIAASCGRRWPQAETHFQNALEQVHEIPHRIEQPEVRRWYAQMLLDRDGAGDALKARQLLSEALASYKELGMPKHVEMVEALL